MANGARGPQPEPGAGTKCTCYAVCMHGLAVLLALSTVPENGGNTFLGGVLQIVTMAFNMGIAWVMYKILEWMISRGFDGISRDVKEWCNHINRVAAHRERTKPTKIQLLKRRYLKHCYPWYQTNRLTQEESDALRDVLPKNFPRALREMILDFARSLPQPSPLHQSTLADRKEVNGSSFLYFKPYKGQLSVDQLLYTARDTSVTLGGDSPLRREEFPKLFYRLADFMRQGEMFCVTIVIQEAIKQGKCDSLILPGNTDCISLGFVVNYDNTVRTAIHFYGKGSLRHAVRTPTRLSNQWGAENHRCGYYHDFVKEHNDPRD